MAYSKGYKIRKALFEKFVINHNHLRKRPNYRVTPDIEDTIICPICMKLFERKALRTEWVDHLTLEDVPPKSLGGNPMLLTCKICNNIAGTQLDVHLLKKLESEEVLAGISNKGLPTRFKPGEGIDLSATIYVNPENGISIEYFPNRSDPEHINRLKTIEDEGRIKSISAKINLGYKEGRPEVATVRIAYLYAISLLGYGFLVNENLSLIREQIKNSHEKLLPHYGIFKDVQVPNDAIGVNLILKPYALRSFFVVFDLETELRKVRYGVVLPGPTAPGLSVYDFLNYHNKNSTALSERFTFIHIADENVLAREDLVLLALDVWNSHSSS